MKVFRIFYGLYVDCRRMVSGDSDVFTGRARTRSVVINSTYSLILIIYYKYKWNFIDSVKTSGYKKTIHRLRRLLIPSPILFIKIIHRFCWKLIPYVGVF